MRIAVLDDIHQVYEQAPGVQRLRARGDVAELRVFTAPFGDPAALRGFQALIANRERTRFTRELLEALPELRLLVQTGSHAYHIDLEAARERGLVVAKATGSGSAPAAELAIGLMLSVMRGIPQADAAMRRGEWPSLLGHVLDGKTLGVLGLGRVGAQVARIAGVFGMRVLAWSRSLTDERASAAGVERRDLEELLREADVVSVHLPLASETRGLLDARRLGLLKPTAYLVNTARGPIVDEAALVETLRQGRIAGAALDVFDQEPLPPGHPLTELLNVVLTPHLGWPTDAAYAAFSDAAATAVEAYLEGRDFPRFL